MNKPTAMRNAREAPPAIKILAVYLAISLVPAVVSWSSGRAPGGVVGLHVVALAVVATLVLARGPRTMVDWLPLVTIPFLYAELPRIAVGGMHDGIVQGWETAIFGVSPAQTAAARWPYALLSESLHAAYLSYYLLIYGPPIVLYLRGQLEDFRTTVAGVIAMFALCYVVFIAFPVEGPRYEWTPAAAAFNGPVRRLALRVLAAGSSRGTAFPSSHVAVATVQAILAFRWSARAGLLLSALTSCLAIGAVYGGFHYGVDVLAGGILGLATGLALVFTHRDVFAEPITSVAAPVQSVDESAGDVK